MGRQTDWEETRTTTDNRPNETEWWSREDKRNIGQREDISDDIDILGIESIIWHWLGIGYSLWEGVGNEGVRVHERLDDQCLQNGECWLGWEDQEVVVTIIEEKQLLGCSWGWDMGMIYNHILTYFYIINQMSSDHK